METKNIAWDLFYKTGSVESYLLYSSVPDKKGDAENAADNSKSTGFAVSGLR